MRRVKTNISFDPFVNCVEVILVNFLDFVIFVKFFLLDFFKDLFFVGCERSQAPLAIR